MPITDVYQIQQAFRQGGKQALKRLQFEWLILDGPGSMSAFSNSWPALHDGQRLHLTLPLMGAGEKRGVRVYAHDLATLDHHRQLLAFAVRLKEKVDGGSPNLLVGWYDCKLREGACNFVLD